MNPPPGPPEYSPAEASSAAPVPAVPLLPATSPRPESPRGVPAAYPPVPGQMLDEFDLGMPPRRRFAPLMLFLATCFFTYAAGAYRWEPTLFGMRGEHWDFQGAMQLLKSNWHDGLIYMSCVMALLLAHEMGHFLMTVRYHIPASYPIFLPMPSMLTGTMGAVIGMEGSRANRRQMFDIGLAGPLAGLVLTVPLVWIGIKIATPAAITNPHEPILGAPLLAKLLTHWLRPDLSPNMAPHNPIFMAGWVGMLVTGLNMMPISQLDGGHVIYALFLKKSRVIARAFLLSAIAFVVFSDLLNWTLMLVIVTFIGVDHPPTADDSVPLGTGRAILGTLSLAIPVLCFTPYPLYVN